MDPYFLHLEKGEPIPRANVVGVFDFDEATKSEQTRRMLASAQEELRLIHLASDLPRSILVVQEAYCDRVYLSGLSVKAIKGRLG